MIADTSRSRSDLVEAMAADLVRFDSFRNEADAIRSLYATERYHMGDIVMLIDDVRQAAAQSVVAREMAAS